MNKLRAGDLVEILDGRFKGQRTIVARQRDGRAERNTPAPKGSIWVVKGLLWPTGGLGRSHTRYVLVKPEHQHLLRKVGRVEGV